MKQFYSFSKTLLIAIFLLGYSALTEAQQPAGSGEKFSMIILPDAQNYTSYLFGGSPSTFTAQTQWCINNQAARNIKYIGMVGDLTNESMSWEWTNANTAMSKLDATLPGIPYGVVPGNHDLIFGTGSFNSYFGVSRFQGRSYYGGHYGTTNENHYDFFSSGGLDFIVICLGSGDQIPSASVLDWADALLKFNMTKRGIIINHSLMYAGIQAAFTAPGQAIYNSLKDNPNLFMMVCGHEFGSGFRTDTYNGNNIYTMIADYQDEPNGGNGWLRIAEFDPPNNVIHMTTYSTKLNSWKTTASDQFDLQYNMMSESLPVAFNVTGSGSYCQGTVGIPVGLSGSQTGVIYTLYKNGIAQVPEISGTGSPVTFGNQLAATYTVKGTNSAGTTDMTGSAVITVTECAVMSVSITTSNNGTVFRTSPSYSSSDPVIYLTGKAGNFGLSSQVTMTAVVSGGSGSYTYAWSPATGLSATSGATVIAKPSAKTTYTLKVTDSGGTNATQDQTITINSLICGTSKKPGITMCVLDNPTCVLLSNTKIINNKSNFFGSCSTSVAISADSETFMRETEESMPQPSVKAYPNPTNGNINLELKGFSEGKANLNLFSSDGSLTRQESIEMTGDEQIVTLDLSNLSNGIYLVQIFNSKINIKTTIIKQ